MMSPATLREKIAQLQTTAATQYTIGHELEGAFVGRSPNGRACLLVPTVAGSSRPVGRISGRLRLSFPAEVKFEVSGHRWKCPAAVVECCDDALLPAFCALAVDVADRLTAGRREPTPAQVAAVLAEWERLLRAGRRMSEGEQLGLWGELALILDSGNVEAAVAGWRGPFGDAHDFLSNGVAIECKATRERLRHHVSLDQVTQLDAALQVALVSLWVGVDSGSGTTLPELVAQVAGSTNDLVSLEKALAASKYSHADSELYTTRYRLLEGPQWFQLADVPRVRSVDPGVVDVRYVAHLDELRALEEEQVRALLDRFTGP